MAAIVHALPAEREGPGVPRPGRSPDRTPRAAARALGCGAALLLAVAAMVHGAGAEARALRGLSPGARSHLYARTLQNLDTLCGDRSTIRTTDFCREQAQVAMALPECDGACRQTARAVLHVPTR